MIVDDFNFHGAALSPSKANAPLVVDANAVLALSVASQRFETMRRRNEEVGQPPGGYNALNPHTSAPQYRRGQAPDVVPFEYSFGLPILEPPHRLNITFCVINVKGYMAQPRRLRRGGGPIKYGAAAPSHSPPTGVRV